MWRGACQNGCVRRAYLVLLHELLPEHEARLRITLETERGRLVSWGAQLEWLDPEEGRFVWVARYDTAGGRVHRDRNRIARHEPTPYAPEDPEGLTMAQRDLRERAREYIEGYGVAKAQRKEGWP